MVPNLTIRETVTAEKQVMHCQMHAGCHPGSLTSPATGMGYEGCYLQELFPETSYSEACYSTCKENI